jgi:hypothetical protein
LSDYQKVEILEVKKEETIYVPREWTINWF